MKKLIAATLLVLAAWVSSFAQGNFTFVSNPSTIWDTSTVPSFKAGPTLDVAVLWSANINAVPTNYRNGLATPTNGFYMADWAGILTDPNFHLALDTAAGNPVIVKTAGGTGPGAGQYNGGIQYINGTAVGQQILLYVLGWQKSFGLDPVAASLAGAPVGFSSPIQYTLGSTAAPAGSLGIAGISSFGVGIPEPATFALAGLGAPALLIFRRRRNH